MTQGHATEQAWATLLVSLSDTTGLAEEVAADLLQELGALLAEHPQVGGVETRGSSLCVYTLPEALPALRERAGEIARDMGLGLALTEEVHLDQAWRDEWKRFYRPLVFGEDQLLVRPSWIPREPGQPETEIVLDPGRAFGTGLHESTQLCLQALCRLVREKSLGSGPVLDLGCGSGILALAAARLLPVEVWAVDDDPEATETTLENAEHNRLGDRLRIVTGTLADVGERFGLILANIRPETLAPLAGDLNRACRDGGIIVLSGILQGEDEPLEQTFEAAGFRLRERSQAEGWCALVMERG